MCVTWPSGQVSPLPLYHYFFFGLYTCVLCPKKVSADSVFIKLDQSNMLVLDVGGQKLKPEWCSSVYCTIFYMEIYG